MAQGSQYREKRRYKVGLILLIALAAISGARKDFDQFVSLIADVHEVADKWVDVVLPTVHARAGNESCSVSETTRVAVSQNDFRWTGRLDPGKAVEIKGISGDISAEPANGSEIEVVANKSSRRSDRDAVKIQYVEHAGGVTICALYPSEDPDQTVTCEPGNGSGRSSSVRNNDVRVDFKVRVPAGIGLIARTVNGEISAASLAGNVSTHTVNGSIRISTSGYAEAKTVNGEILARLGDTMWSNAIEFKTVNGTITLDLPANLSTQVTADTFNGDISSDFPLSVLRTSNRKHLSGTIGSGGRELVLKTLNGSINLRRAG